MQNPINRASGSMEGRQIRAESERKERKNLLEVEASMSCGRAKCRSSDANCRKGPTTLYPLHCSADDAADAGVAPDVRAARLDEV